MFKHAPLEEVSITELNATRRQSASVRALAGPLSIALVFCADTTFLGRGRQSRPALEHDGRGWDFVDPMLALPGGDTFVRRPSAFVRLIRQQQAAARTMVRARAGRQQRAAARTMVLWLRQKRPVRVQARHQQQVASQQQRTR